MEGCRFFISASNAILCKVVFPKLAILKIRWATVNTMISRCGELATCKESSLRVVLKDSPKPPMRLVEASSSKDSVSTAVVLKGAPNVATKERGASPACDKGAGDSVPSRNTQWTSTSTSSYARGCDDIDQQLSAKKLECQLCGAANDVRMNYCHACKSLFGASHEDKEGFKRLTAGFAQRFGFTWKFTAQGFVSMKQDLKRALKHGKVARRGGFSSGFSCAVG